MVLARPKTKRRRGITRGAMGTAGIAAAVVLIAGCGSGGAPAPTGSGGSLSSTAASSTAVAPTKGQVAPDPSDPVAKQLCDQIKPQLSDWRVQGPTLGGTALNITVHQWALGNGGLAMSARVLTDKAMVDRITIKNCPDVRTDAIQALNLPDLASGILF